MFLEHTTQNLKRNKLYKILETKYSKNMKWGQRKWQKLTKFPVILQFSSNNKKRVFKKTHLKWEKNIEF